MIQIDTQRVYLNEIKKGDFFCLFYMEDTVGTPIKIYKTFKTLQALKKYCKKNFCDLELSVVNLSKEEIKKTSI